MKKVISRILKGFKVGNSDVVISNLQYAHDTLFIREVCV